MTDDKIRELVAKIRKLVPGKNDWRTLLDGAAEQAADALEEMLEKKEPQPDRQLNFANYEAFNEAGRIIDEQMAEFRESLRKALFVPIPESVKREVVPLTEPVSIKKALLAGEVAKVERAIAGETAAFLVNIQLTGWRAQPQFTEGFVQGFNFGAEAMLESINSCKENEVTSEDVHPTKVPKGWTLVPDFMSAKMVNAWSGGPAVSSDSVALRTSFQEGWKRVLAVAPKYTPVCDECKDTGYVPDGNHCMACSEPATAQAIYQVGTRISNGIVWGDVPFGIFKARAKEKHAKLRVVYDMPPTEVKIFSDPNAVSYASIPDAIAYTWVMYQEGKASADHNDKQVFTNTLKSFADWLTARIEVERLKNGG